LGAGLPLLAAAPAVAQDMKEVAESKVPAAVANTARANYLDAHDVVYRRPAEGKEVFVVNFTTPQNVRLQVRVAPDGRVVDGPELAPNQPDNAPKKAERQRLADAWVGRVQAARATTPATPPLALPPTAPPPVAAIPSVLPGAAVGPGGVVAPPAVPVSTEVRAGDLPATVRQTLERYTNGARDVRYYSQRVEDRTTYQAVYTDRDGSRREVTIHPTGSLVAGPLILQPTADDRALQADVPEGFRLATALRVEPRDIPAAPSTTLGQYLSRGTDVRYRRDTYADGNTAYTAHWVQPESSRRYFVTVGENGSVVSAPRLSTYQPVSPAGLPPAAVPVATAAPAGGTVRWDELPDRVRRALELNAHRDRDAQYFRQVEGTRVSYGSLYTENREQMWVRVSETGDPIAGPVSAKTGKPVDDRRDPPPAADIRLTDAMLRDRVKFDTLPKRVQEKLVRETEGAKEVTPMRHERGGKTYYHTVYTDRQNREHELWLDERGEVVAAPRM
ncbi:MAG: hypothetical protein JWO31_299, partial [Phycisphaerales bacterium]|nr:hypothetical protein [Phycisphaerales bacterium]